MSSRALPRWGAGWVLRRSAVFRQTSVYTLGTWVNQLLGAAIRVVLASLVSVASFGIYSFSISFLQLSGLLFEFGLFLPAARRVARSEGEEAQGFIGAALALFVPIGLAHVATVVVLSFFVDSVFRFDAGPTLLVAAPIAFVYPFGYVALQLAQAGGRLGEYAVTNLVGQVVTLAVLILIWAFAGQTTATVALVLRGVGLGVGSALLLYRMQPLFRGATRQWRRFAREAREYGFEAYVGRVLSTGTYNMDVIMLGAFADARSVALYALAGSLAAVGGLPVLGFASALFRQMVAAPVVRRRWLIVAWGMGIATALLVWGLSGPFLDLAFPTAYHDAVAYVAPLVLAQVLRGVTGVYNSFLAAQGAGRPLRNAAIVLAASNVALNFLLIPPYGAAGAAWASVLALLANYGAHVYGYRGLQRGRRAGRHAADVPGDPSIAAPDPLE